MSILNISRFDQTVGFIALTLCLVIVLLIWRGEQIDLRVIAFSPTDQAEAVSTSTDINVTFNQPLLITGQPGSFQIDPPLDGTTRRAGNTLTFSPVSAFEPNTFYTITVSGDVQSQSGKTLEQPLVFHFQTSQPRLLYLGPNEENRMQLYQTTLTNEIPQAITTAPFGVMDYQVADDHETVVFSGPNDDDGSSLWLVDLNVGETQLLLDCGENHCSDPNWSPGRGQSRLIYTRRDRSGPPSLWWFDLNEGETTPVFEDEQTLGYAARFSENQDWLAYLSPMEEGVRLVNLDAGDSVLLRIQLGSPPAWSPDGRYLIIRDTVLLDGRFTQQLFRIDVETQETTNLSGEIQVEDAIPSWSPNGQMIAFGRTQPALTATQQIWLMNADGSNPRPLTDEPQIFHNTPAWSDDGQLLAFQRYSREANATKAGIWLLDINTGEQRQLTSAGRSITWLP
ncbi:MAG: Ig-like domain-containing protein [Chloroflexota bacterium]